MQSETVEEQKLEKKDENKEIPIENSKPKEKDETKNIKEEVKPIEKTGE